MCDDGFVMKMKICVALEQCGCVDKNGTKHQVRQIDNMDNFENELVVMWYVDCLCLFSSMNSGTQITAVRNVNVRRMTE